MIPWEREIYITQLIAFIKEENESRRERAMNRRNKMSKIK